MSFLYVIGIAFGLAMDAFAVAIVSSAVLRTVTGRQMFRLAFHFGLFQALMPVIGWLAGTTIEAWVEPWDHWVAFGLLLFIGGKMIVDAVRGDDEPGNGKDPSKGLTLVGLAVATSIDALAVGISFAMLDVKIWLPCLIIGLVAAGMTIVGLRIGARLGQRFGTRMEILGGIVLIGIGVKILVTSLMG